MEQKRQSRYGSGVLLSTVHGVKGEEFKHIIILDGAWNAHSSYKASEEEERRLYYVAMTRAVEQLLIMSYNNNENPHIPLLDKTCCVAIISQAEQTIYKLHQFYSIGLKHLYLSYAAKMESHSPNLKLLQQLNADDRVSLVKDKNNKINILSNGIIIAQLSREEGYKKFHDLINSHYKAKISAMIRRTTNPENPYDQNNKQQQWWLPVIELQLTQ